MPKFTITTNDSARVERSEDPLEFLNTKAACDDAQIALAEMAREKLPNGKHADFGVCVEDEGGKEIYRATLDFNALSEDEIGRAGEDSDAAANEVASHVKIGLRE